MNNNNNFANQKVLVTGASGFIGSHMVKKMVEEKAQVSIFYREGSDLWRLEDIIDKIALYQADIRDESKVDLSIRAIKPDYVFHMAAYGVDSRDKDYYKAVNSNVLGTLNLLKPLINIGCKKFLNIGTCMEYGDKSETVSEKSHLEPFNIYGSTKASATILAHQIAAENEIDIVTLRAFGIFGEGEGSHKFFPHIILSILKDIEIKLTGCEQYRDYTYIENIIEGFVLAAKSETVKNEIMNIGSGSIRQLREYVTEICQQMGTNRPPVFGAIPYRKGEVWRPHPDITKIKEMLNWEPKVPLEEGIARTIKWYGENKEKYMGAR